jgi:predicted GIY-YIG superfamily endonuclease
MYFMRNQRNGSYYCEVWENLQWNTCTANGSKQDTDHSKYTDKGDHSKYTDKGLPGIIKSVFQSHVGLGSLSLSNITNATSHGPADSKHTDMFILMTYCSSPRRSSAIKLQYVKKKLLRSQVSPLFLTITFNGTNKKE